MSTSDIALYRGRVIRRAADRPARRSLLSHYLRQLWARQWRMGSGGPPPPPPPDEPATDNPWNDPALWMLMFH